MDTQTEKKTYWSVRKDCRKQGWICLST